MLPYEKIVKQCTCVVCGREFFPPEEDGWAFTITKNLKGTYRRIKVCSWHCQRVWEHNHPSKREAKKYLKVLKELAGVVPNIAEERSSNAIGGS